MLSNLPNFLTIGRILLVPVTIWALIHGDFVLAFCAFLIAGLTDGLDGFLARRYSAHSELGAYLDPLADKAMLVSIYVTLAILQLLPGWLAIIVVTRDVLIVAAVLLARYLDKPVKIRPVMISKVNTFAQIALAAGILASLATGVQHAGALMLAAATVSVLTLASFGVYMQMWLAHMTSDGTGNTP